MNNKNLIFQHELNQRLLQYPERIAIEAEQQSMSYAELIANAQRITQFLLQAKLEPESVIVVLCQNRMELIPLMIGIMNARCVFVPVDSGLPTKRLQAMLQELKPAAVIASYPAGAAPLWPISNTFFVEDILQAELEQEQVLPNYEEEDSLYIYFTSGSTGMPKGIVGMNQSLLHFLQWEIKTFELNDRHYRCSQFISPYFDAFLRDVFVPLFTGGTICVPPDHDLFLTSEEMIKWLDAQKINLVHCVPSLFRLFNVEGVAETQFSDLSYILLSGEKILPAELKNWYDTFGNRSQLVNLYGATEATMISTYYKIQAVDVTKSRISIGQPIWDTELMIVDNQGKACNMLIPGELCIVSDYLTKGYLNRADLTEERFVVMEMPDGKHRKAYKTGDMGRLLPGGEIELLGRKDRQVKIRGVRVELDEIEHYLVQLESIQQAVVIAVNGAEGEKTPNKSPQQLLAFYTSKKALAEHSDLEGDLKKHLAKYATTAMMPSRFIALDQLPLLPNGKVNYKELLQFAEKKTQLTQAANTLEVQILEIWKDILGLPEISTTDSFQALGGNSLSILKLIGKLYSVFNVRISLADLFQNLTIVKQAALIKNANTNDNYLIEPCAEKTAYRLSSAQERIYYHYQLDKQSQAYNLPIAWKIKGCIDGVELESILRQLVDRHESFRTSFHFEKDRIKQFIAAEADIDLEVISCEEDQTAIDQAIQNSIRAFDLSQAPLLRCTLITIRPDLSFLVVDVHHIICDGISQVQLLADMLQLWRQEALPPLILQYKDFSEWEHTFRNTEDYLAQREFWLRSFEGDLPVMRLPLRSTAPEQQAFSGANANFVIDLTEIATLTTFFQQENITAFAGFYSLFLLLLAELTGEEDLIVGINTSGRVQEKLEGVIGMFVKTLPIRYRIDLEQSFPQFTRSVQQHLVAAQSNQLYDLSELVSQLNQHRSQPLGQLFNVMFVYQNFQTEAFDSGDFSIQHYPYDHDQAKYPLSLFMVEGDQNLNCRLEYSTAHFTTADIEQLRDHFLNLLGNLSNDTQVSIASLLGGEPQKDMALEEQLQAINFSF